MDERRRPGRRLAEHALFDETADEAKSQGWTALVMDTNGNGKRDDYVEANQPVDPAKDKRFGGGLYSVAPAPDGSVWGSVLGMPGAVVRLAPGANPPDTALAEVYEPPFNDPNATRALRRAAAMSIATASPGWRSRAVISRASIGGSARAR